VAPQPTPAPAPSPLPARAAVPGRASMTKFSPPEMEEPMELELTPAPVPQKAKPKAFDPSKRSASWVGAQPTEPKKSSVGMIGLVAAASALAGLVFLGVKLLVLK